MEFTKSLIKGKLIKRYKRFFTDVKLQNETVTAHCPNTGSMKGLLDEDNEVYLLPNDDPKQRKPDITKAKTKLNWEPKINLEEGLTKTISWVEEQLSR